MVAKRTDLVVPIVHLNGTAQIALERQFYDSAKAVENCLEVLQDNAPSQRDYYVKGSGYWLKAEDQHRDRIAKLKSVYEELVQLYEEMSNLRGSSE